MKRSLIVVVGVFVFICIFIHHDMFCVVSKQYFHLCVDRSRRAVSAWDQNKIPRKFTFCSSILYLFYWLICVFVIRKMRQKSTCAWHICIIMSVCMKIINVYVVLIFLYSCLFILFTTASIFQQYFQSNDLSFFWIQKNCP